MDLMDLIDFKTSGRLALQILHENAKRSEGCVLKRKCGDGDDAKAGESKLNRDQIKRTIPLDMQNKRPELKNGKQKKLFAQLSNKTIICKMKKYFS